MLGDGLILQMSLLVAGLSFSSVDSGLSGVIVEVEVERPPIVFFFGPKWVSLNSVAFSQQIK